MANDWFSSLMILVHESEIVTVIEVDEIIDTFGNSSILISNKEI